MKKLSNLLKVLCLILLPLSSFSFILVSTNQNKTSLKNKFIKLNPKLTYSEVIIEDVFLAQTHVLRPEDRYFILTANRKTLLKVNITAADGQTAPEVTAGLNLGSKTTIIKLTGPHILPQKIDITQQSFENSFTVDIDPEWIQPGLTILVKVGNAQKAINHINIGANNTIRLRYFDFLTFGDSDIYNEINDRAFKEMEAKLPISKLDILYSGKFDMPAVATLSIPSEIVTTWPKGGVYCEELAHNLRALQKANGEFFTSVYGARVSAAFGGQADTTSFTCLFSLDIFLHELGHCLGLLHNNQGDYPYKGNGINQFDYNAGPIWAYDPIKRYFIPPTIQENSNGGRNKGWYKHEAMSYDLNNEQEKGYYFTHFSDYNMYKMKTHIDSAFETKKEQGGNEKWDTKNNRWVPAPHKVWELPLQENIPVYSLFGVVSITPGTNFIYNPMAYTGNLIRTYDPTNPTDKKAMKDDEYCNPCNLTLKLIQGGKTKYFALNSDFKPDTSFEQGADTWAVNVAQNYGKIELMQLLFTPNLARNGFPKHAKLLKEWKADRENIPKAPVIAGMVWNDENRNGKKDENEEGIAGVKIVAWQIKDSQGKSLSNLIRQPATTNEKGEYRFVGIDPGTWQLIILGEPDEDGGYKWEKVRKLDLVGSNFSPGKVLYGYQISPCNHKPNDKIKGVNYGIKGGGEEGGHDDWVITKPFRIAEGGDPYRKVHPNSLLNIDFGFYK